MKTKRTYKLIDSNTPGFKIAAETSAVMATSSIVFRHVDRKYARHLLNKAKSIGNLCTIFSLIFKPRR
ncbi:putative cellulase [Medicago truncatula]|uniref:cellulase n=1 Tax=Medicago truncatula TaxID=3880 RepID=A0A396JZ21_MEDTR|nr:putative cellulase [Medicago truncatula]